MRVSQPGAPIGPASDKDGWPSGKLLQIQSYTGAPSTFVATVDCVVNLYAWAAGGAGIFGGPGQGGWSGATGFKRFRLRRDQVVSMTFGAAGSAAEATPGGDTVIIGPDGLVSRARGGQPGGSSGVAVAEGFDDWRPGSAPGGDGLFGGVKGAIGTSGGLGGGGAPGWQDVDATGLLLFGGAGGPSYGGVGGRGAGGGGGFDTTGAGNGGAGGVVLIAVKR